MSSGPLSSSGTSVYQRGMGKDETAQHSAGAASDHRPVFPSGRASFDPPADAAAWLWRHVVDLLGDEREQVAKRPVSTPVDLERLRSAVGSYDFGEPLDPGALVDDVAAL